MNRLVLITTGAAFIGMALAGAFMGTGNLDHTQAVIAFAVNYIHASLGMAFIAAGSCWKDKP